MALAALALAAAVAASPAPAPDAAFAPVLRRYEAFFRTTPTRLEHDRYSPSPTREIFWRERYRLLDLRPYFGGYVPRGVYPDLEANRAWVDFARDVQAVPVVL